jgi:polyhydroxyalkanoate synthesis regulator phasin
MIDALKRYTQALSGLADVSRQRAEQIANALAKQGLVSTDQVRSIAQELARRGEENRERLLAVIRRELPRLGVASRNEVERLKQRVQALEANQRATSKRSTAAAPVKAAKRSAARKAARV